MPIRKIFSQRNLLQKLINTLKLNISNAIIINPQCRLSIKSRKKIQLPFAHFLIFAFIMKFLYFRELEKWFLNWKFLSSFCYENTHIIYRNKQREREREEETERYGQKKKNIYDYTPYLSRIIHSDRFILYLLLLLLLVLNNM